MAREFTFGAAPERLRRLLFEGLEEPPGEDEAQGSTVDLLAQGEGDRIGRYRLLRVLGEGGMGVVYLAQQAEPIKRQVALKVIKPGMDSKRVIARFENERQALALLDHPNIAHVYDAGTTDGGRPYFVMECVEGLPITEYCDRERLTIEERLRLFQQVCLAVHHAHQKGIIHRDLKPANIIVSTENGRPTPKIIDFGVAKALAAPLTEKTLGTEDSQLLGTPEYMSPEQADMASEDIDTRSDIYSLGVLLYILLTGALPFDSDTLRTGGIEHIRQVIRESDPKTPSARVARLDDEGGKVAERRRTQVRTLAGRLRRELEWIPLKAMRKDPAERYRSAAELADDIEHYLKGEPLMAGPLGKSYRLKKFVRRNRIAVGGVGALLVVLVVGVAVSTVLAIRAERARVGEQLITDFLTDDVLGSAADVNVGEATVSFLLDAGFKRLGDRFKDSPLTEAKIRDRLAWTYRQIGELDQAERHFLEVIRVYREYCGEAHPATLRARSRLGWVYRDQGRYDEMERLWAETLQMRQRFCPVEDQLEAMNAVGVAHLIRGRYGDAESLFEKMRSLDQRELRGEYARRNAWFGGNLAVAYLGQGRYEHAERLLRETIETVEVPQGFAVGKLGLKRSLAATLGAQGRYGEAERLFDETLEAYRLLRGDKHPETLTCMLCFAQLRTDQEHYGEAEDLLEEALSIVRERPEEHRRLLTFEHALAVLRIRQGRYDEAETLLDRVLEGIRREKGEDHPNTIGPLNDFGVLRREQQRYEEAESLLRQALDGRQQKLGLDHPARFESMHELAVLYIHQARYQEAEPLLLDAFHGREVKLGPEHPHTIDSLKQLVTLYESWPKPDEAAKWRAKLAEMTANEE